MEKWRNFHHDMKNFNHLLTEAEQNLAKIRIDSEDPDLSKTKQYLKVGFMIFGHCKDFLTYMHYLLGHATFSLTENLFGQQKDVSNLEECWVNKVTWK